MSYSEPLLNQPRYLFLSVGAGALLCIAYVLTQSFFRLFGEGRLSYYVADGLFCTVFALFSFFFMIIYCSARVRLHLIIGEAAGFFITYFSFGRYIYSLLSKGSVILRSIILLLFKPYALVFSSFIRGTKAFFGSIWAKIYEKRKKFNLFDKIHLKNSDKSV